MADAKKILVAEDEKDLLEAIETVLNQSGYQVFTATDGRAAVSLALQEKPDLIMLDIRMPVMDGLDALREIRADEWGVNVPIIMLTAQGDINSLSEAVTLGGTKLEYLTKTDWKLSDVVEKVQEKLGPTEG